MSIISIVRPLVATSFVVTIAGPALARRPPALVAEQRAAQRAVLCEGAPVKAGAPYRGVHVGEAVGVPPANAEPGRGYRDLVARFGLQTVEYSVACTPASDLAARR